MQKTLALSLYRSDSIGNPKNCIYPQKILVENEEQLREAVRFDHVFVKFRENRRSNQNFEYADLLVLDCDNDHSDIREDWIWPEDLAEIIPDVAFATYSSRNDNVPPGSTTSCPWRKWSPPRQSLSSRASGSTDGWVPISGPSCLSTVFSKVSAGRS